MTRREISDRTRIAYQDDYEGWVIEVAIGYAAETDDWMTHVYVTAPAGSKEKIAILKPRRPTSKDAVEHGFESAFAHVDQVADWRS